MIFKKNKKFCVWIIAALQQCHARDVPDVNTQADRTTAANQHTYDGGRNVP